MKILQMPRLSLLLLFATLPMAKAGIVAGPLTNTLNNHIYYVISPQNWSNAQITAQSLGGHLTTIRDQAENNWIITNILTDFTASGGPNLTAEPVWTGLYDPTLNDGSGTQHATDFIWISGEPYGYRNWEPGEPNNNGIGEYWGTINWHYAAGYDATQGTWNDTPLNGTTSYPGNSTGPYYGLVEIGTELSPQLTISPNGNQSLQIAWLAANGFVLQQNTNLLTQTWTTSSYTINNSITGTNSINFSPAPGSLFFRLYQP